MEEFNFEKLNVYKRSLSLAIEMIKIAGEFPIKYSRIQNQLVGALLSISLNIAEGTGRTTPRDKINFYNIARASSFECIPLLEVCIQLKLIHEELYQKVRKEIVEISKMISGLIKFTR